MEEPKKRDKGKMIHPRCGQRYPSDDHAWTPALIKRHEAGCPECQLAKETGTIGAKRSRRIRERLEAFYRDDEAPFETDD